MLIVSVEKEKKGKPKEVLIYCKEGCDLKPKVELQLNVKTIIGDTNLFKYEKISEVKIIHSESNGLYLVSVKNGGEKLLEFLESKREVYAKIQT